MQSCKEQQGEIKKLSQVNKETEENNRMGKTRNLFKKVRDIKGIFHERMGMIKDRNSKDLAEAQGTKIRWQDYREEIH